MKYLLTILLFACTAASATAQSQNPKKEWVLVQKQNGSERRFKQGQKLTVKWQGISGIKSTRGALLNISTDSTTLEVDHVARSVGNKDIVEISANKGGSLDWLVGVLLILCGIVVIGFFLLLQLVYNATRLDFQLASGEQKYYWPWSLLGVGMILWGILGQSNTERTVQPFGQGNTIEERSTRPDKMP